MQTEYRAALAAAWSVFFWGSLHSAVAAEPAVTIDLAVDDPRPLSRAIDELRKFDPYPISYEDPQYAYSEDIRDISAEIGVARAGKRVIVPGGGRLEVRQLPTTARENQLRISAGERRALAEKALRRILEVQATQSNGGKFAVEQSDQMLHVVPARVRNQEGEWVQQTSILSPRISIASAERNVVEMLNEICTAVTKATGTSVGFASGPLRTLYAAKAVQGAVNEPARDVLIRTLNQAGEGMTWKLWYAPDLRGYALNIVTVPRVEEKQGTPEVRQKYVRYLRRRTS